MHLRSGRRITSGYNMIFKMKKPRVRLNKMKNNVSLVLSGGGARGIAHIGVIEVLEKQGFNIKSISGTSMGALVGGTYAVGKMQEFKNWLYTLDKLEIFRLLDFTLSSQGFVRGEKVFNKMRGIIPDTNIEDLKINYAATAVDLIGKKEMVFTKGSLFEAIRASVSIPTVFTPVESNGHLLVDGGVLNNIPISNVRRTDGDILIVVHVNADIPVYKPIITQAEKESKHTIYREKISNLHSYLHKINPKSHNEKFGYFNLINTTLSLLTNQVAKLTLEKYSPDILINVSRDSCSLFDFYKAEELVEVGRYAALTSLREYNS